MTDKNNNAALAQFFDGDYAIKKIGIDTEEKMIFSGNHYRLPEMVKYQKYAGDWILRNSKKRCEVIETKLLKAAPKITKETIRTLLSKEIYNGLSGHYYTDYFGTLYSIIFDLTDLGTEVCFGTPTHNKWQQPFDLNDSIGEKYYTAIFPDKSIKTDILWSNSI